MKARANLFWAFLRVGLLGFGGGPAMIPLIHAEVVARHGWLDDEEFSDILAIANTLPGPIATKMPGYIGYRVAGSTGCMIAIIAMTLPMTFFMITLLGLFSRYQDLAWIQGMGQAVVPVVMVMMLQLTWDFFNKSRLNLGWIPSLIMFSMAGLVIHGMGIHPGILIGVLLLTALFKPEIRAHEASR